MGKSKSNRFIPVLTNSIKNQTTMTSRSLLAALLLTAVSFLMVDQGQALLNVDKNAAVRRTAGTPHLSGQGSAFQRPELMEVPKSNGLQKQATFDTDAYRHQMTVLVYNRSM